MKNGTFVMDAHTGFWDASKENCKNRFGDAFIETFYAFQTGFNPPDKKWTMDYEKQFRKVDPDWYIEEMFVKGDAEMAILSTQVLMDFYHTGFTNSKRNAKFVERIPERLVPLGGVDPRMPNAVQEVERQVQEDGMRGFKWYTAEWRGQSRGWSANDPAVFPLYEKCIELGIKNMHFHKGPAVEPLTLQKFDVRDIDEPAWLYPELNFIIDHVGLPRLDDFCWIATRCPNVYGSLAVALAFIHTRPRYFAEIMANLLFWIGPDRIIYGTDFPIWYPHWQLDEFMEFELPEDLKAEYGVDLTMEMKQKIIGGNIMRLYGIDAESKLKAFENDEVAQRKRAYLASQAEKPTATDTGVAGTVSR
jgi:predicted TIM-barrel fold metal-dependent hydrolase